MNELLELQTKTTLREWCMEKEIEYEGDREDLIKNIVNYYKYLDLLYIPCTNGLSESVFSVADLVKYIASFCPNYQLFALARVNKTCRRSISMVKRRLKKSDCYIIDSARYMDWYHVHSAISRGHKSFNRAREAAARGGYELVLNKKLPSKYLNKLLMCIVSGGNTDRHYRLFTDLHSKSKGNTDYTTTFKLLELCVVKDNLKAFEYILPRLSVMEGGKNHHCDISWTIAYYGRIEYMYSMFKVLNITDHTKLYSCASFLAFAYAGGHQDVIIEYMLEHGSLIPSSGDILERMTMCCYGTSNIGVLTHLIKKMPVFRLSVMWRIPYYLDKCTFNKKELEELCNTIESKISTAITQYEIETLQRMRNSIK